uniref:A57890f3-5b0e-426b-a673-6e1dfa4f6974-CDS n=1 Tax=Plasmodiophora brassicae TaxID=37360 RepID=A0A3P3YWB3_PLABS|nr:a57890f3-5b0e-426b-a673-6e1dfa4f6974-CDS [Plasmodiophora brassicae]
MKFKTTIQFIANSLNTNTIKHFFSLLAFLLKKNNILNLQITKTYLPLYIKKFTILKSPHVHKTARTQLEIRTYKYTLYISNISSYNMQKLMQILNFSSKNLPHSLTIQFKQKILTKI